jgi:apolipoprotein N-acyltransferase
LNSTSPGSSVRGMYGSFMIKFFICLVAAFVYMLLAKKNVNKAALIICMGLYIVYTAIEVSALQKLLKQKSKEKVSNK